MISTKINDGDIAHLKVASLPSRPTAPRSFGGAGYTATEMKQAFDRLPLYIISRFNELIEDLGREGREGVAGAIPTGILEGHTLADMISDVGSGAFASYLDVLGAPLTEVIASMKESLRIISESSKGAASLERVEGLEASLEEALLALHSLDRSFNEYRRGAEAAIEGHGADISAQDARLSDLEEALSEIDGLISSCRERLGALEEAREIDRALIDELRESGGSITDMIIDCGGPADLTEVGKGEE